MLKAFLPKGAPFFEYLLQQSEIMCSLCALAPRLIEGCGETEQAARGETEIHREANRLESKGDELYVLLIRELSQTFITPIDREDIWRIGKEHEAVIDLLQNLVERLYVLHMGEYPTHMRKLAANLNEMALLTRSMLKGLSKKRDSHDTRAFRVLRNECENLISNGLEKVLAVREMTPQAVLTALKLSRAYDRMEQALEQVTELAEAIEEATLKNV